jgi:hypothetical protein
VIALEPWERKFVLHSTPYRSGTPRRSASGVAIGCACYAVAPLVESAEVYLLGTGLLSYWSVKM